MPNIFYYIATFLLGATVGSFINVCIYRLPRQESIVFPASHCPKCNTPIKPYDNIPILSWLILRGKCRACQQPISIQYPIVEAITAITFVLVYYRLGISWALPAYLFFAIYLLIAALTDLFTFFDPPKTKLPVQLTLPQITITENDPPAAETDVVWNGIIIDDVYHHENVDTEEIGVGQPIEPVKLPKILVQPILVEKGIIPDEISIGGTIIGLLLALISEMSGLNLTIFAQNPLIQSVLGFFVGAGSLYLLSILYRIIKNAEGMGLGDVKLLGMIGVFLGWKAIVITIFAGSILSLIITIPYLILAKMDMKSPLPFGPFLAVGALIAFLSKNSYIFF